ncbi:adhesin [Streptomyces sp. NPDC059909]|uniref:adhesin n=1 Tax=Streptomyces sp. NPDC059909 TaxID=3346998 RepID=UPI0036615362
MGCPDCGFVVRANSGSDTSWIARETFAGRISTLTRLRKALLATGAVVVLGCFIAAAALISGSDAADGRGTGGGAQAADDDISGRGIPTRLGPTALPDPDDGSAGVDEWAGPGCTTGTYREGGRFENGHAAWYSVPSGGWRDESCDGSFTAVPMSGSTTKDRGGTATWSWELDQDYRQCSLAVFVPLTTRVTDVAGDPTFYRVLADPDDPASGYTGFGVRQTEHRGDLVPVGSYPVRGDGVFAVQLIDRGRDWGAAARVGAHHAAAQMRLTCRS